MSNFALALSDGNQTFLQLDNMTFHQRYLEGDRQRVWQELRQLGAAVRHEEHRADTKAVVDEAMRRAKQNVITVVERLREQGYDFGDPHNEEGAQRPHAPPDENTPAFVKWLEDQWGPIPMTVRAWIEIVGDVNLLGSHPAWPDDTVADPLVVEFEYKSWRFVQADPAAARAHYVDDHDMWKESCADEQDPGCFVLDVAPDALHKANISGGAPYAVLVPDASVDATFRFDDGVLLPFIEYLRLTFRHGCFPGFWKRAGTEPSWKARRQLAEGLLEL